MSRDGAEQDFLAAYRPQDYPAVALAVDLVVFAVSAGVLHVALVRRGGHPFKDALALPGGFVRRDEDAYAAARRELTEETGLNLAALPAHIEQLATFSDPHRDPRMRVVSVAHLVLLATDGAALPALRSGSDAAAAGWHPVHGLAGTPLAFDHAGILRTGLERLAGKMEYTMIAARLLPDEFTVSQLRTVYEAVWNTRLEAGNFTRKMKASLAGTGRKHRAAAGAPAALFTAGSGFISPPLSRP